MEEEHVHQSESWVDWLVDNKLKAIGYTWLAGVGGSLVRMEDVVTCSQMNVEVFVFCHDTYMVPLQG